jgi:ATP-dependent Lon protease
VLDEDHYDLDKVKERIIEHLAVSKLRNDPSGQILCFVGPPGVGKTSLGQSIARTLERRFSRLSVGGVRDEAEIRGHRRTYIGAMPGSIIRALRDAESMNPVLLIDEIDKMGADVRGDPASAMLEVLDPEQNRTFRDHYLDLPFDLSKVLFICTANTVDTIPGPLLDRMDVISLSGYTEDEKLGIAKRYLVPKQIEAHGLTGDHIAISDNALRLVIREYTHEAGVRGLERRIADLCRKAARKVAEGHEGKIRVDERRVRSWLGPRRFSGDPRRRTADPGVATGLAYTAAGGDVLFIEATAYPGKGRLTITGQLGEVMQESAQAALSWVRAHTDKLGLPEDWFAEHDVHLHVPAGAIPKDGPSAGITMATAIASLVRGNPVSDEVGMTGEITLTGQVLPIGGVREKVLAAQRAGLKRVILPSENEHDLDDLPAETRRDLDFVLVDSIDQVFDVAFSGNGATPS